MLRVGCQQQRCGSLYHTRVLLHRPKQYFRMHTHVYTNFMFSVNKSLPYGLAENYMDKLVLLWSIYSRLRTGNFCFYFRIHFYHLFWQTYILFELMFPVQTCGQDCYKHLSWRVFAKQLSAVNCYTALHHRKVLCYISASRQHLPEINDRYACPRCWIY